VASSGPPQAASFLDVPRCMTADRHSSWRSRRALPHRHARSQYECETVGNEQEERDDVPDGARAPLSSATRDPVGHDAERDPDGLADGDGAAPGIEACDPGTRCDGHDSPGLFRAATVSSECDHVAARVEPACIPFTAHVECHEGHAFFLITRGNRWHVETAVICSTGAGRWTRRVSRNCDSQREDVDVGGDARGDAVIQGCLRRACAPSRRRDTSLRRGGSGITSARSRARLARRR
jgi:hypothetical protein